VVTNKIRTATSDLAGSAFEQPEESAPGGSTATEGSEPVEREQGKSHQVISTAAYYSVEGHEPDGYVYDEAQDWLEADAEASGALDGALYTGKDF
jgi:hypothetical protein